MADVDGGAKAKKPLTKTELMGHLSEKTGLAKKDVQKVFEEFEKFVHSEMGAKGSGKVSLSGFVKFERKDVAAKPAREVRNPRTGEMMMSAPKPASKKVKASALKALKDSAK